MLNALLLVMSAFSAPHLAMGADETPAEVITHLHNGLISTMKDAGSLGFTGRYARLQPLITSTLDLDYIARFALLRFWAGLDHSQRADYLDIFRQLTVSTYASRFDGYNGERFRLVEEQSLPRERCLVRAALIKGNGEPIEFEYILHQTAGHWRIINIIVDGVSNLAIKRTEYSAVMKDAGFETLLDKLRAKISLYAGSYF